MENIDKHEVAQEVMAMTIQQQATEDFKKELLLAGASDEAVKDLMNRVDISAVEVFGSTKSVIKDNNGTVMQSKELITKLKNQLPSYFGVGATETTGNIAPLSEHYLEDIVQKVEAGEIKQLDDAQKAAFRKCFKSLTEIDYGSGAQQKKLGKYTAVDLHRIMRKCGGLIQ